MTENYLVTVNQRMLQEGAITNISIIYSLDLDKINLEQFGHTVMYFAWFLIYNWDYKFKRGHLEENMIQRIV